MTNSTSPSVEQTTAYESAVWVKSKTEPGVRLLIRRMSLNRRIELTRAIRELGKRAAFLEASQEATDRLEAAALASEIDRAYLMWGLAEIEGLSIDGERAAPEELIAKGPEGLAMEAVAAIKAECGLSESERKN